MQEEFQIRNLSGDPSQGPVVDGIFGPTTDAAVRGFQQALHADISSVTVDGIVGPVTWRAAPLRLQRVRRERDRQAGSDGAGERTPSRAVRAVMPSL
ncbi:MAG: peptidoglycan-binding domain-containing protein [Kineosporiaceae bacterium]